MAPSDWLKTQSYDRIVHNTDYGVLASTCNVITAMFLSVDKQIIGHYCGLAQCIMGLIYVKLALTSYRDILF